MYFSKYWKSMIATPQEHPIYFAKVFHCVKGVTTLRIGLKATKLYLPTSPLLRNVILVLFLSLRKYDTLKRRKKEVKMENPGSSFLQLLFSDQSPGTQRPTCSNILKEEVNKFKNFDLKEEKEKREKLLLILHHDFDLHSPILLAPLHWRWVLLFETKYHSTDFLIPWAKIFIEFFENLNNIFTSIHILRILLIKFD